MNNFITPFVGLRVVESVNVTPGKIFQVEDTLFVHDYWSDLELPLILDDNRKQALAHLARVVAAAEQRLGLHNDKGECPECASEDPTFGEYLVPSPVTGNPVTHTCENEWHDSL